MFATFVIGLREGLEAALIVGIIAAFLKRNGTPQALRHMWIGVGVAVVLCLAGGIALQLLSQGLPQQQQEMLECVVAAVAVVLVSYMVLWMKKNSRGLKAELERSAGTAVAMGSAFALISMAFLAVLREGFETAVFLLAAFQSSGSAWLAVAGAALGIAVALVLGWLIYRGGVRLNLSKFFRITGVVLVLVAAGLVAKTFRAAYEAGWLTIGQQTPLDLSAVARPGSVQASLLTGVLGISAQPALIEIVAYLLYLIPMLTVVLWPPKRPLTRRQAGRLLTGVGAGAAVVAVGLALAAPGVAVADGPVTVPIQVAVAAGLAADGSPSPARTVEGTATVDLSGDQLRLVVSAGDLTIDDTVDVTVTGHDPVAGRPAVHYRSEVVSQPSPTDAVPATVTGEQLAAASGGTRLPIGLRAADAQSPMAAAFTDSWRASVAVEAATGAVVYLTIRATRTVQVTTPAGLQISGGTVGDAQAAPTAVAAAALAAGVVDRADQARRHEVLGQVLPLLLGIFAVVMLAFGLPRLLGSRHDEDDDVPPSAPAPPPARVPLGTVPTD